jgi:protease IV
LPGRAGWIKVANMDNELPPDFNPAPAPSPAPPPLPPAAASPPPPINRPPPIIAPSTPPRPAKSGNGWKVFAVILIVVLVLSVLMNLVHAIGSASGVKMRAANAGPRLQEVTVRDEDSSEKIAVVPIEGIISGEPTDNGYSLVTVVKEQLKLAGEDSKVKAVILKVDSPGGEVLASDEIANAVRKCRKPVIVSMGSLAASGGYYVSVPSKWIVANELTITGSIGVIMHGLNYRGLLDKIGVQPETFKSGKYKDMLSPTREPDEVSPEEKKMVQDLIDQTFAKFKQVVQDGRVAAFKDTPHTETGVSQALAPDWADFADGRVLSGSDALKLGFVDELGDFDVAVKRANLMGGTSNANLIEYAPVFDFSNFLRMLGQTDAKSVKVDLGVDIPKLRPGCEYFLPSTYFY